LFLPIILSGVTAALIGSSVRVSDDTTVRTKNTITIKDEQVGDASIGADPVGPGQTQNSNANKPSNLREALAEAQQELQKNDEMKTGEKIRQTVSASLIQLVWLPMSMLLNSFSAITFALLYLKTRQAGGESMTDLLSQFEESERPRSKWQNRIRERLLQSGRTPSSQ
jgi:hypothetical protein